MGKVAFIARFRVDERHANAVTGMKTAEALARRGLTLDLILPLNWRARLTGTPERVAQLRQDMAVREPFSVREAPWFHWGPRWSRTFSYASAGWARMAGMDCVWSRDVYAGILAARMGLPVFIEHHTEYNPRLLKSLGELRQQGIRPLFVSISEGHRTMLRRQGLPEEQVILAPLGVDPEAFNGEAIEQPADWGGYRASVMYVGSLYPGRGTDLLLEAAHRLPQFLFLFVGGRPDEIATHEQEARRLNLKNVRLLGRLPNSQVPGYMKAADILVAPYTDACEAIDGTRIIEYLSPTKLFEYMAAQKPILATNVGSIGEVIRDEENGLLAAPDADGIVSGLLHLAEHPEQAQRLAATAREESQGRTWDARIEQIFRGARALRSQGVLDRRWDPVLQ